jgi:hypothetical protein
MPLNPTACPSCGSHNVRVVITRPTRDYLHILRRRKCVACAHRWYTLQDCERIVTGDDFTWVGRHSGQDIVIHEHRPPAP